MLNELKNILEKIQGNQLSLIATKGNPQATDKLITDNRKLWAEYNSKFAKCFNVTPTDVSNIPISDLQRRLTNIKNISK